MAGDIAADLKKLGEDVRRWATIKTIKDSGYRVDRATDYLGNPGQELTLKAYEAGARGNDLYVRQGGEVWNLLYGQLDWVPGVFTQWGKSDLSALDSLMNSVGDLPGQLLGRTEWQNTNAKAVQQNLGAAAAAPILMDNGLAELGHWSGRAASVFKNAFGSSGDEWRDIVQSDFFVSEALLGSLQALAAVDVAARGAILAIGAHTVAALQLEASLKASQATYILGAIVAVTLTLATGGLDGIVIAAVAAAFTITGTLASKAEADAAEAKPTEWAVTGDTAASILSSMSGAVSQLTRQVYDAHFKIDAALKNAYNGVLDNRDKFEVIFDAKEPDLADANASTVCGDRYLGKRSMETDTYDLTKAATEAFPDAANLLSTANGTLAGLSITDSAFYFDCDPTPCAAKESWTSLRNLLRDIVGRNASKVHAAGRALLWGARAVGAVDADAADQIDKDHPWREPKISDGNYQPLVVSPLDIKQADR